MLATACSTATNNWPHQRRVQPEAAAAGRAGGAPKDRIVEPGCNKRFWARRASKPVCGQGRRAESVALCPTAVCSASAVADREHVQAAAAARQLRGLLRAYCRGNVACECATHDTANHDVANLRGRLHGGSFASLGTSPNLVLVGARGPRQRHAVLL